MKILERIFIGLMLLGAIGHLIGTFTRTDIGSVLFVWSLSGVLACSLVVALNVIRHIRPGDRLIAFVSFAGNLSWLTVVVLFGLSVQNIFDPRVLMHAVAAIALSIYASITIRKG